MKDFNAYQIPKERDLRKNGVYVSTNHRGAFFLYENGMCKVLPIQPNGPEFWSDPAKGAEEVMKDGRFYSKEDWGRYVLNNNQFIIQNFNRNGESFCKRWLFEERGYIDNDSTIIIQVNESIESHRRDTMFAGRNVFQFYPMNIKPDSTVAWFLNKNWYKRGMDEANL